MMGPGTLIARFLSSKGIKPRPGCGCYELAAQMDTAGPEAILTDLDGWADEMYASVMDWRKAQGGVWVAAPNPPRWAVRSLIEWACHKALAHVDNG